MIPLQKCRKKKYDSIHDRFIRDKTFRKAMFEVGRSEQMIKEMDKLASEDHTNKASREEIEFYRGSWWIHTNVAHFDSIPTRYQPDFKKGVVDNAPPQASGGEETCNMVTKFFLFFLAIFMQTGGSLILTTHLKDGMTTDCTEQPVT